MRQHRSNKLPNELHQGMSQKIKSNGTQQSLKLCRFKTSEQRRKYFVFVKNF